MRSNSSIETGSCCEEPMMRLTERGSLLGVGGRDKGGLDKF